MSSHTMLNTTSAPLAPADSTSKDQKGITILRMKTRATFYDRNTTTLTSAFVKCIHVERENLQDQIKDTDTT